jgi:hypothetical protein
MGFTHSISQKNWNGVSGHELDAQLQLTMPLERGHRFGDSRADGQVGGGCHLRIGKRIAVLDEDWLRLTATGGPLRTDQIANGNFPRTKRSSKLWFNVNDLVS